MENNKETIENNSFPEILDYLKENSKNEELDYLEISIEGCSGSILIPPNAKIRLGHTKSNKAIRIGAKFLVDDIYKLWKIIEIIDPKSTFYI